MATLKECFTQEEWAQLMEAKEMVGRLPIQLNVLQVTSKAVNYKLSFGNIELNGAGYDVAAYLWPDTEAIIRSHFTIAGNEQ